MLPLAIGLMGVGAAGSAYGIMKGRQKYNSPTFADIDLAKENPVLYAELQKYSRIGDELQAQYNQRRMGPSPDEIRMRESQMNDLRSNMASRGALGGSTSILAEQDLNKQFQDQVMARAFQEQQALAQARANLQANQVGLMSQAQGNIYNQQANAAQMDYQSRVAHDQARNQFFTGLMGAGAGMYGNQMMANNMAQNTAALQAQNNAYQGVPQQQPVYMPAPQPMPQQPTYQFGQYSPYARTY